MGLDMHMMLAVDDDYEFAEPTTEFNELTSNYYKETGQKREYDEVAYWRKHPDLHRLFEEEWLKLPENKGKNWQDFNGQYFKMTAEIIDNTMFRVSMRALPSNTGGFFFGESMNNKEEINMDLEQLGRVKRLIEEGNKVYYYSSF